MDDSTQPNPMLRRNSIAGPFMRHSTGIPIPAEHRSATTDTKAATTNVPPPLTRANTVSGGWFGNLFGGMRRSSLSSSTGIPRSSIEATMASSDDSYGHLASSAPGQVTPPKHSPRDTLTSSGTLTRQSSNGVPQSAHAPGTSPSNVPPLSRRLSETALQRSPSYGNNTPTSPHTSSSVPGTSPTASKPPLLETDLRQGPIETDLFWLVLRDIGE